jgi:hypothetical protein
MNNALKIILSVLVILYPRTMFSASERGTEKLPFNSQLRQLISQTFYEGPDISPEKIAAYHQGIEKRYWQIANNLKNVYTLKENLSLKKAVKKVAKQGTIEAYQVLLDYLEELKTTKEPTAFNLLALKVLEMDDALKISGKKLASTMLFEKASAFLKRRKIPIRIAPKGEASNLIDPATGLFYSQTQLARMKQKGIDISKLDPPVDSTFWTPHDIGKIDIKALYQTGQTPLHKGLNIVFPGDKGGKGYYKKIRRTQTKPKIDIFITHKGKKLSFKLKIGSEMHSEITAASLYAALGFSVDISKYVRDFKLVLGDTTPHQFKRAWNAYYSRYDVNKYIKRQGKDEEGHYIVFYEGLLEAKPNGLLRVGPWAFGRVGHNGLREVRGTLLFDIWIANMDLKEAENNKLVLRKTRKTGEHYRFFHIQHDMGFAFGSIYIERPGDFYWRVVKKKTDDYIHLSYRCLQQNSIFKYITFADAKWMVRLIAQLSREQIQAAVELGGWPESMGKLLVEKLIARRNQMVSAFNLLGQVLPNGKHITFIPFNRYLTTGDGVVVKGKLKINELPGYIQYFGPRIRELIPIIARHIKNAAVDGVVNGLSTICYLKINPEWMGLSPEIISRIIISINREVELNPKPTGERDDYLVQDTMEIGFRLGYGFTVSGDVTYVKKYTVVYPVKTEDEGRYHNHFIINLLLPGQIKKLTPQDNFVAIIEDYLKGRGSIKIGGQEDYLVNDSPVGTSLGISKIYLGRHFISRKDPNKLIYFKDKSVYKELDFNLFLEFAFLFYYRIPLFKAAAQKGALKRTYVEMDLGDMEAGSTKLEALERLLLDNDTSMIEKLGVKKILNNKFFQEKTKFNLLGFFKSRSIYRVDHLKETGSTTRFQVESQKQKSWRFLDNGECYFSWIRFQGKSGGKNEIDEPLLTILMRIEDRNTKNRELKHGYLDFMDKVALRDGFIDFDAEAHSQNRCWGYIQVYLHMTFYREAIQQLLKVDEMEIWETLASVTSHSVQTLIRASKPPDYRRRPPASRLDPIRRLAWKTAYIIQVLKKARKTRDTLKKMSYLVKTLRKAIYTNSHGFDPTLLSVILRIAGKENFFISAALTMPVHKEMVFPERIPLYNETGVKRSVEPVFFECIFDDPAEIYHLF